MAAIAWSYAALVHLQLEPSILFHEDGYQGDSANLIENFEAGRNVGVPLLEWYEMTRHHRHDLPGPDYPQMHHWLRMKEPEPASP